VIASRKFAGNPVAASRWRLQTDDDPRRDKSGQMPSYRFRLFCNGEPSHQADHPHEDDLDALDTAEALAENFEVEVWRGQRFVARIKKGNLPPTVHDPLSG
jgi:hypothetical protein